MKLGAEGFDACDLVDPKSAIDSPPK